MKHLLCSVLCLLLTAAVFSQKIDTTTSYQFVSNAWVPNFRTVNSYNSSCLVDSSLGQTINGSTWRNALLSIFTYTSNNLVDTLTVQTWDTLSSNWRNLSRTTSTYNSNNKVTVSFSEIWDTTSNVWVAFDSVINSYNTNNLLDSSLTKLNFAGTWSNSSLTINHYNVNNLEDTSTVQNWLSTAWANSTRVVSVYNGDSTVNQTINQTWDLVTSSWANQSRNAFTYNTSKQQLSDTSQKWTGTQFSDTALVTNTYDVNNHITNSLLQKSTDNGTTWLNDSQTNFSYNSDGTLSVYTTQNWNGTAWVNQLQITLHYSAGCALPLTLLNFTATLNGKAAQLQWTTVTEINTRNFIVQRSIDAINFNAIGTVNAAGNSTQKISYQFVDASALNAGANKIYYRLQMFDKDGKFTYSKIAMVQIINGKLFVIYPNPVRDQLLITSNASLNNAQVRITDQSGKVVYQQQIMNMQGGSQNKINVSSLNKGIYYLQLITGSDVQTTKFLKY